MINEVRAIDISTDFAPATKFNNLSTIINLLVSNLFTIAGIIFFIVFIYAGFKLLKGGENSEEIKKIQMLFFSSIVGMVIIFASYFIVRIIFKLFNLENMPL